MFARLAPYAVLAGKYRVESVLGRGGMGTVVRAHHLSLDEVVAIKVLGEDVGLGAEVFARFMREAKTSAKLRSTHAVRVTDVGRLDDGLPYMVMELLDGRDLSRIVAEDGPLPQGLAIDFVLQACEVLAEAHALGIVHRDIKPSNLFVITGADGTPFVKVLDFGIAKAPHVDSAPITRTLSMLGTPEYMSPEQLRSSRTVDHRADIWALGVVLYELLVGRRPFETDSLPDLIMAIALQAPRPLRVPAKLARVIMRCLEKEPEDRYATIFELATDLARFADDADRAAEQLEHMQRLARVSSERIGEPMTVCDRPRRKRGHRAWPLAVALAAGAAAGFIAYFSTTGPHVVLPAPPIDEDVAVRPQFDSIAYEAAVRAHEQPRPPPPPRHAAPPPPVVDAPPPPPCNPYTDRHGC